MVDEIRLKIHKFHLFRHRILRPCSSHTGAIMLPTNGNGQLLLTIIFFDRWSLDYWSFSMTGNIWGGQQSLARSWGSDFPPDFNALTGCRYRQNEIDALKRLSLYAIAMPINKDRSCRENVHLVFIQMRRFCRIVACWIGWIWKFCSKGSS